ncbi:multiubiquitin domain-containing protein [Hoeflea alexandrii]|uniref:multiubiquitin domain-containing protein n=1 Tax=Hoeflea alexandrii TaxID=288436 RepID=UPI003610525F
MTSLSKPHPNIAIEIASTDLVFTHYELDTETPTGGKIAKLAGFTEGKHAFVLQWMADGDLESLRAQEEADLAKGTKFIVAGADASNRILINGNEIDWPADTISGAVVRQLGKIPADKVIYLERVDEADKLVEDTDLIKIRKDGIESFESREPKSWELNVQGKVIKSATPTISVVDALTRAGFDPNAWIIILRVAGQPKRQLSVSDTIDLTAPGIEKVRLTARDVNNGEARPAPLLAFPLLEIDESYLDEAGFVWETMFDAGNRWLIIRDYPVPEGFTVPAITLALQVPESYPQSQIDMFYCHPVLHRTDGAAIPATEATQNIGGISYQRWSRHRGPGSPWNPAKDNVVTHLALVESAIAKEVGQ